MSEGATPGDAGGNPGDKPGEKPGAAGQNGSGDRTPEELEKMPPVVSTKRQSVAPG